MIDEWGGIDKKIKKTVSYLNILGIPTTGSCEGHVDHGSPAPWIKVTIPHEPKATNTTTYQKWQDNNKKILRKVSDLFDKFYEGRNVPRDIRLVIKTANSGFWIHNGGNDYDRWRTRIDKNVVGIQKGKQINKKELERREKKLRFYQGEIELFEKFLKKKVNKN